MRTLYNFLSDDGFYDLILMLLFSTTLTILLFLGTLTEMRKKKSEKYYNFLFIIPTVLFTFIILIFLDIL